MHRMDKKNKIALAACSGMSPYGLVSRVTSADIVAETDNVISICMGATSADRDGFQNLIKKYPIIVISGCDGDDFQNTGTKRSKTYRKYKCDG